MPEVDNILNEFGVKLVSDLRKSLVDKGVTFGGGQESKLSAKIRFEIKQTTKGIVFNLVMPDYSYYVDKGRKKGPVSKEGRKLISQWAKRKGIVEDYRVKNLKERKEAQSGVKNPKALKKIPFNEAVEQITFVVARSIGRKGYKGNKFLTETITDGRILRLEKDISDALKKQIIIDLKTQ